MMKRKGKLKIDLGRPHAKKLSNFLSILAVTVYSGVQKL